MDNDDVIEPHALATMAAAIDEHDDVDYLYSDQDKMTNDGTKCHQAYAKPDWSPERLRHLMYTGHFSVLRRSLVQEVGGFRPGYDGSQDHDLVLRVTERARRVVHVPEVLYHWREVPGSAAADALAKPYAWDAGVRAVQDHLDRVGINGTVSKGRIPSSYHVEREPDVTTPVSVIIPTIGSQGVVFGERRSFVVEAVRSVAERTRHTNVEFVIVYDEPTPASVLSELRELPATIRLVPFREKFNFSAKCNAGAAVATGDVLIFLNDDIEARTDGVIERLIAPLSEPGVGMTGPKLVFEDLRVQHAGVIYGGGDVYHAYYKAGPEELGILADLWVDREVSALTGACVAVRADVFREVGGFMEALPLNFNDVDFALKVRSLGLRLVWLHAIELFHFESTTRQPIVHRWERQTLIDRWGPFRQRECYSNVLT
jgi:GT2 family glycosyltransferase